MSKRKTLTVEEKLKVLNYVDSHAGQTQLEICKELGIPTSTLNRLIKSRGKIEGDAQVFAKDRKRARGAQNEDVETELLDWFKRARTHNVNIDGPVLKTQALKIASERGLDSFQASNGWFSRFTKRHGVTFKRVCGEERDVDRAVCADFRSVLPSLLKGYAARDIYNADELGLFYHLQPDQTWAMKGESCTGGKKSKDRLTVLLCANADGSDKMKPLVIGKSAKPRCFKNVRTLPCTYKSNSRSWMTGELFTSFVLSINTQMVIQNRHIVLLVDNCAAHPKNIEGLTNVKVMFLPPNTTSHLQPMDAGVIANFKRFYRAEVVRRRLAWVGLLLDVNEQGDGVKISVLDALHYISQSWAKVTASTIRNCFAKCGFNGEEEVEQDDDATELLSEEDWIELNQQQFEEFCNVDNNLEIADPLTSSLPEQDALEIEEQAEQVDIFDPLPPSNQEIVKALDVLRRFGYNSVAPEKLLRDIAKVETAVMSELLQNKKQSSILDYFNTE